MRLIAAPLRDNAAAWLTDEQGVPLASTDAVSATTGPTALGPATIPARSGGQTLTVTGANFSLTDVVRLNGKSLPTTYVDDTTLTAVLPHTALAAAQAHAITVAGTDGFLSDVATLAITAASDPAPADPPWLP